MKSFKEVYEERIKKKKLIKKRFRASTEGTGIALPSYTGSDNYVNQPPVGNPPNVGYTQSTGS